MIHSKSLWFYPSFSCSGTCGDAHLTSDNAKTHAATIRIDDAPADSGTTG